MDGAGTDDDREWWVRRAVIAVLVVVGVATAYYAVVETRSGVADTAAEDTGPIEVVTDFVPTEEESEGPLRLGRVLVVGRHGAPVERPAHTAESYEIAIEAGVDHVEAQVVMTRDGELLVHADHELGLTTDVADRSEFADRETTKTVDGETTTGWFTEDFTLEELLTLDAVEPDPEQRPGSAAYDGDLGLLGFDDLLAQVGELAAEQDREVGIWVEPRRASYFRGEGLPMERAIARSLRKARLVNEPELVTVESDDLRLLERLELNLGDNVLAALVVDTDSAERLETDALADLPDAIDVIVAEVGTFTGFADDPSELPARVHDAGFAIAVYPISYENALLTPGFRDGDDPTDRGNLRGQVTALRTIGVDVVLAESPAEVVEVAADLEESDD